MYMKKTVIVLLLVLISINTACSSDSNDENMINTNKEIDLEETIASQDSNMEVTSFEPLSRSDYAFMTSKNGQVIIDKIDEMVPAFMDIISVKKEIDEKNIIIYLELRELPQNVTIHQSAIKHNMVEYSWRINFDTNRDNSINHDTTIDHHFYWQDNQEELIVAIDDPIISTIVWQHQVTTGHFVTDVSFNINNNTMIFQVEKGDFEELQDIDEDTPFYVMTEHNSGEYYLYQMLPRKLEY